MTINAVQRPGGRPSTGSAGFGSTNPPERHPRRRPLGRVRRPKLVVAGSARDAVAAEPTTVRTTRYQFTVHGDIAPGALAGLPGDWTATSSAGTTVLHGPVANAIEMHRVLAQFDALGVDLLNLHRLETGL
ncbi:hypothetical protein ACWDOP_24390 [Nocardia sp. NPDC003693]